MKTLYWDFFGPDSNMFAKHHARHLHQFADRESLKDFSAGEEQVEPNHHIAFLKIREEDFEKVNLALRPKRTQ